MDLFRVSDAGILDLRVMFTPANLKSHYRAETHIAISARAYAKECASEPIIIVVDWDGQWNSGEMEMDR